MKLASTPRRLLQLDALFVRRGVGVTARQEPDMSLHDTHLFDDIELQELFAPREMPGTQLGRIAAEVALEEGGRRFYAPRQESEVLESRRRP